MVDPTKLPPEFSMSDIEARQFILKNKWKTAKSGDHSYLVLSWFKDQTPFTKFMVKIDTEGFLKTWWGKTYKYINVDEYTYWYIPTTGDNTVILNRALITNKQ